MAQDEDDVIPDESEEERKARLETEVVLDPFSQQVVDQIADRLLLVVDEVSGHPLYPYQRPFARRLIESLIINDGATITALFSRQSGKSETVANVVATCMIMLPILARIPKFADLLEKFREGLWVGAFAPVEDQADTLFGRIVSRLTGDGALDLMADPEIDDSLDGKGKEIKLKNSGSLVRKQTCHPRATIEGRTYHLILIDECFPAGTPILTDHGWVPIEEIVNDERREWMVATQGADGLEWTRVRTGYKTRRRNALVRVVHEHGTLYSTANHPFMVNGEEVPAIHLRPGTPLSLVQGATESSLANTEAVPTVGGRSLREFASGAVAERNGTASGAGEDGGDSSADWTSAYYPWGQRAGADETAEDVARRLGTDVERRACDPVWRRPEAGGITYTLQGGSGEPDPDDRRGGGRGEPRIVGAAGTGPAEDLVATESRVVSVSVLEPGNSEFDQFSDGADYVYTLEVEHESHTYVAAGVVVGNCQGADEKMVNKSISPMGSSTNATTVYTGTPTYEKGVFYKQIQFNRRSQLRRGARQDHFEADWRECARWNKNYEKYVKSQLLKIGEDSDEFKLSYRLIWLLDRGMFITSERIEDLGDKSMEVVHSYHKSPIVIGIDPARKQDSTIATAVWVNWDNPDEYGYYDHRILNWLDLSGLKWEEQYFRLTEFISNYSVMAIGVDEGGLGDVVIDRLRVLMPSTEVVALGSGRPEQSKRWKHLGELVDRGRIGWPAHAKTRRLKTYRRFRTQMEDLQKKFDGPYVLASAPREAMAHDDYADSLALACSLTKDFTMPTVEVGNNMFFERSRR